MRLEIDTGSITVIIYLPGIRTLFRLETLCIMPGPAARFTISYGSPRLIDVNERFLRGSGFTREEVVAKAAPPGGDERVLVVDDEPSVVDVVSGALKRLGYKVTTAQSGSEGWKRFSRSPSHYDLVITDHVMPDITGLRLAEKMFGVRPDLPIILSTGYSETVSAEEAGSIGISEFLMKAAERKALAEVVRKVLDRRAFPQ